jgi:hypothetical protein
MEPLADELPASTDVSLTTDNEKPTSIPFPVFPYQSPTRAQEHKPIIGALCIWLDGFWQ